MRVRRGLSTAAMFGASAVIGVMLGASLFYLLPRNAGGSSAPATQSATFTTSSTQAGFTPSTAAGGGIGLTLAPANRILGPSSSQDFALNVLPAGQVSGSYSLTPFALAQGLSVSINPNPITLSGGSQTCVVTIHAGPNVQPGTYQIGISATGAAGRYNQTFALLIVSHLVQIAGGKFTPSNATIPAGSQVVWINLDVMAGDMPATYQIQLANGGAMSPVLNQYDTWSYTFTTPGRYSYSDKANPGLAGTVVVVAP